MNQDERKKFWDVLLTMHDAAPEHIQQLQKTIIIPNTLCRFRAVNENSLVQLQENKLYFSTSDYYDDPFDTYFYLDYDAIDRQIESIVSLLNNPENKEKATKIVTSLGNPSEDVLRSLDAATQNPITAEAFEESIKNVRSQILKTLYSICFCEDPLNETLWLKYADSHRGFVVTYDFHSADTYLCGKDGICKNCPTIQTPPNIYPVYYSNEKYDASRYAIAALLKVSMASSGVSIPQGLLRAADASMIWEIERISLLKKPCHVFDEEWRMIYSQWCVARPCIKLKPKSVIIGYRTPLYKERLIISAATVAGIKDVRKIQINRKDELEAVPIQIKN